MYITELTAGDEILIKLHRNLQAYPSGTPGNIVYRTGKRYNKGNHVAFIEGTGKVISNTSKVLSIIFSSVVQSSLSGLADIDYHAIREVYLYEGETNATTVAKGLNNVHLAPAMNIYRKKVILRWTD